MEALFSTTLASFEAWILIFCIVIFIGVFVFDGVAFVERVIAAFTPKPPIIPESLATTPDTVAEPVEVSSPMLEEITPEEIQEIEEVHREQQEAIEIQAELNEQREEEIKESLLIESPAGEDIPRDIPDIVEEVLSPQEDIAPVSINLSETTTEETGTEDEKHKDTIVVPDDTPPEPRDTPMTEKKDTGNIERLYLIVNEVKTLIARNQSPEARALIIEGLSLDKNHRELNLILGSLYEADRQYQKAEYVYKDLALIYSEDVEILEKLANILIIEKRYDIALEIYKKIISLSGETEGSLYIMTHLTHELGHNEELYAYARRYQKNWPNNPDILTLLAEAEIALGQRQDAIQTLIKLKNLTPYNNEIMETIAKLTMEEELAGNFGGEKI